MARKPSEDVEGQLLCLHAEMCKVFSHPTRLKLIDVLREREMSVGELADRLGLAIGNLSQHLTMMRQRGVLKARKEGNVVHYRLANPKLLTAFDLIRDILHQQLKHQGMLVNRATKPKGRR